MGSTYGRLAQPESESAIWDCQSLLPGELKIKFQQTYPFDATSDVKDLDLCFQNFLHVDSSTSGQAVQMLSDYGDVTLKNYELYRIWERVEEGKKYLSPAFLASDPQQTGAIPARTGIEILMEAFFEFDQERVRMVADYFLPTFPMPLEKVLPVELDKLVFIYSMTHMDQDRQRKIHGRGDLSAQSSALSLDSLRVRQQIQDQKKFELQQQQLQLQIDEEQLKVMPSASAVVVPEENQAEEMPQQQEEEPVQQQQQQHQPEPEPEEPQQIEMATEEAMDA